MSVFTPQLKHHILTQYQPHSSDRSFAALARLYGVRGGESTIRKWHRKWDGSVASLQRRVGSGRPRVLSTTQVHHYIRMPIRNKRRQHRAVHYPDLLPSLQQKTGRQISLRLLQLYGRRDAGVKMIHSNMKSEHERQPTEAE